MNRITSEKILDNLFDGVYFVDLDRRIQYWNAAAERITGYSAKDVIGSSCADNLLRHIDMKGQELCLTGCPLDASIYDGKPHESNVFLHHKNGHRVPVSVRTSPVRDDNGEITGAVEIFTDNTTMMQVLREFELLKQEVYRDSLTGIGNRKYGEMNLSTRNFEWQEHNLPYGVLFMDIDNFKLFNDNYGHRSGDDIIIMVASSISKSLRKIDVVARWGGEEYIVILPGADNLIVKAAAERIRMLIENSFILIAEKKLQVTVSVGGTVSRRNDTIVSVVQRADQLMYSSKASGRNRVTIDDQIEGGSVCDVNIIMPASMMYNV